MPGENILDWSTTAINNGSADSAISWPEGMPRAAVNNSARSMMAAHAKDRNLKNGSISTSGTNTIAFTSGTSFTSVQTGTRVLLKITNTNTGSATLNMDGTGPVTIFTQAGNPLTGGELVAGSYAEFLHNGTNWILLAAKTALATITSTNLSGPGTYTTPNGVRWLEVHLVGAGSGGAGGNGSAGGTGGNTTFGSFTANGGGGGASGGTVNITGANGHDGPASLSGSHAAPGGAGGSSFLGGAGAAQNNAAGGAARANSGSGGAGGGVNSNITVNGGNGGGAGAYCYGTITTPATSYSYSVGGGGSGGSAGSNGFAGGSGAAGTIWIIEHYT